MTGDAADARDRASRGGHSDAGRPPSEAIRDALEAGLAAHDGRPVRIVRLDRRVSEYSTSFTIEEIDAALDDGRSLALAFKDLGWASLIGGAREVRPRFLHSPGREVAVYRDLLAGRGLGTAACYAAVADEAAGRHWLFLERVAGAKLCHVGEFAAWEEAARWLARFHVAFAAAASAGTGPTVGTANLLRYDEDYYRRWARRALTHLAGDAALPRLGRLIDRYDRVVARLAAMDQTVIHGEFYASNVLVRDPVPGTPRGSQTAREPRICPVDWETAAVDPGLIDLAALTSGSWTRDRRVAMVSTYRDEIARVTDGGAASLPPSLGAMLEAIDYCRIHLAVQWLGWADDWVAPPDQAHDWLGEALAAAESLGL